MNIGSVIGAAALLAASALASTAALANDTMNVILGSVLVYDYGEAQYRVSFSEDGSYEIEGGGGGRWEASADELCITPDEGEPGCHALPAGKSAGDSWDGVDIYGNAVVMRIG